MGGGQKRKGFPLRSLWLPIHPKTRRKAEWRKSFLLGPAPGLGCAAAKPSQTQNYLDLERPSKSMILYNVSNDTRICPSVTTYVNIIKRRLWQNKWSKENTLNFQPNPHELIYHFEHKKIKGTCFSFYFNSNIQRKLTVFVRCLLFNLSCSRNQKYVMNARLDLAAVPLSLMSIKPL